MAFTHSRHDAERAISDGLLLPTFDGVGLGQLGQVSDEGRVDGVPGLALAKPEVDVGARQLVGVELSGRTVSSRKRR